MPLPDVTHLVLFLAAATVLIVVPGPAVFYIVARSVAQGSGAGLVSVLGVGAGASVHVAAAALGVSALVLASATAFTLLKLAGAAYLVYLGVRALLARDETDGIALPPPRALARVFVDGFVVNLLNPKTALFFLAFLPQFVDPAVGEVPGQVIVLGVLFVLIGIVSDGAYALLAGRLASRLRASATARRWRRRFSACIYIGLGLSAAFAGSGEDGGG